MDKNENILINLNSFIDNCMLPELINEVGTFSISHEDFDSFRLTLDHNLVQLFDVVQAYEDLLYEDNSESMKIQVKLIILLCEQTASTSKTFYRTLDDNLVQNLECLIKKHFSKIIENKRIQVEVFNHYKLKLNPNSWKKNLGSVFGFLRFLNVRYSSSNIKMEVETSKFCLSVGLLLRDFYDPVFKEIGIKILDIILDNTNKNDLLETNIHKVIYDELVNDVSKFDTAETTELLWSCLFNCIALMETELENQWSQWSEIDNFLKALINQITFAKSFPIWLILFKFIPKICLKFSPNKKEIVFKNYEIEFETWPELREKCIRIHPLPSFRWAKHFLELFVAESNYLMGKVENPIQALNAIHLSYLICILPIRINILGNLAETFFDKFSKILMEVLRLHKSSSEAKEAVKEIFVSFLFHIESGKQNVSDIEYNEKIVEIKNAFRKVLNTEVFYIDKV